LLLVFGYSPVSTTFVGRLEAPYRIVTSGLVPAPEAIVVLGGGFHADARVPTNFELGSITTVRLVEGIRLWHLYPGARLILSGGEGQAQALAETASFLGVPRERMQLEGDSLDTADEARLLRGSLAGKPFLLVTSAYHMRRSVALFEAEGLSPTPAPADFEGTSDGFGPQAIWPSSGGLCLSDRGLHEWLGILWSQLRPGRTRPLR
jgi:uncharacterized SAM-binding protein YcdF (DUF218 family)